MLIATVADTHITERPRPGGYTLEEQIQQLIWIGEEAHDQGAAALLHAGDLFDRASTPAERNAAIRVVRCWSEWFPVVIVRGNHDRRGDLWFLGELRTPHEVTVVDRPEVVHLLEGNLKVGCLPWPSRATLAAWMGSTSALEVSNGVVGGINAVLRGLEVQFTEGDIDDAPRVLLAHAELGDAVMDNGQPVAGRCDVPLSATDLLETGADVVLLGHIHLHQTFADGRIAYAGSPRPNTFGEAGPHGFCLVEVDRGDAPYIEHRVAPGRKMITEELDLNGGEHVAIPRTRAGQAVRITYEVEESERKSAALVAEARRDELLAAGAHSVKLVPTIKTTHRVRSHDMVTATNMEDRLRALWKDAGSAPGREAEIIEKLNQLEQEIGS